MDFYLPVIIVGQLVVGVPLAGRCYRQLARVLSVFGLQGGDLSPFALWESQLPTLSTPYVFTL